MAFVKQTDNNMQVAKELDVTLPGSATTAYSSVIDFVSPDSRQANRRITLLGVVSAVSGTNIDIGLYGSYDKAGTVKFLLLDAPIADLTNAAKVAGGVIDLNAYPAPYYFIGYTTDADESANTISLTIMSVKPKP